MRRYVIPGILLSAVMSVFGGVSITLGQDLPRPAPTPSPLRHVRIAAPSERPPGWGNIQWEKLRGRCQDIADKAAARVPLKVDFSTIKTCESLTVNFSQTGSVPNEPQIQFHNAALPTPIPSTLSSLTASVSSSSNLMPNLVGPPSSPSPFAGGAWDACNRLQLDTSVEAGQPLDPAADVSSTEAVEFANDGIWVFDKTGHVKTGYPQSLRTFWAATAPPINNILSDTQVAFEPIAQRWVATMMSIAPDSNGRDVDGDILFAYSKTADATQGWNVYTFHHACSTSQPGYPVPDFPVLGYNQKSIAIEFQCFQPGAGSISPTDELILIPHSVITQATMPSNPGKIQAAPFSYARPTRDISGIAGLNLYLVASEVPTTGSALPYLQLTTVDENGVYSNFLQSPGNGAPANTFFPMAHDNCGPASDCAEQRGDFRITSATIQQGNDGNHYLLTSFHAGDRANQAVQSLWFAGQVESFSTNAPAWNGWYVDGAGWSGGYPTITMDNHLDIAFTFTTFATGSTIYPNWYISKGFVPFDNDFSDGPPLLGYGILYSVANLNGAYNPGLVCPNNYIGERVRWGDFETLIWDPNLGASPKGGFWTVQQYSTGGSNESSQWAPLVPEALPYFVGFSAKATTCGASGSNCSVTVSAPSGVQSGDVLLIEVSMGQNANKPPTFTPVPLRSLPASNLGTVSAQAFDNSGGGFTSWLYAYLYGSQTGDTGSYTFKHINNGEYVAGVWVTARLTARIMAYRQANSDLTKYEAFGFPGSEVSNSFSWGPVSPSPKGTLATLILSPDTIDDRGNPVKMKSLTGDSPLTLMQGIWSGIGAANGVFAADVPIMDSDTALGPYSSSNNANISTCGGCDWLVWQATVPE